ncbi:MAG: AGE family epimerase/isomerase [Bacteroidota bacterium]|jgi:N-acylglucosamine 2-epimerase
MLTNELIAAPAASLKSYAELYRQELTGNILPFWLSHSKDEKNGGFFTCLDRQGKVYDTDKFMWLQGRQVWCFSYMYKNLAPQQEWLDMALHGARFMQEHGRDAQGNWYFSLTAEGKPLVQPYNIFSDCFATMAFAALHKIQPNDTYKDIAVSTFENILRRRNNTKGNYNKAYPGTRPLKNFSLPMILCNLSLELEHLLGSERVDQFVPEIIHEVMDVFYHPELGVVLENVQPDGRFSDSFEGRVLNPGHAIEAMWFIMDLGKRRNDPALIQRAVDIMFDTLELGWDKEYGGIFYFLDVKGHPVQQLEWDQKLWWVHVEALVALAKAYAFTGDSRCIPWFKKLHQYTWDHFRDSEYGEWFGYLNRQGQVLLPLKGGKWKGCFHIPRSLYQVATTLSSLES